MKRLSEFLFGREVNCTCICEVMPIELKIELSDLALAPEFIGIEAKDSYNNTSLFKTPALTTVLAKSQNPRAVLNISKQLFEIQLLRKNDVYKYRILVFSLYQCENEFDDIFEDKKCIASFKYDITLSLNDAKLQKSNRKLHFKLFTTNIIQITAFVRILVYQHAKLNPLMKSLTSDISKRDMLSSFRHSSQFRRSSRFSSRKRGGDVSRSNQLNSSQKSTFSDRSIWLKKKFDYIITDTLNQSISDFSFFWADGLAFIVILSRFTRSNIDFNKIKSYSVEKRFSIIKHISQKFNIKFDIKINDFLTFDENYLIEKVVDCVGAILNYDQSDMISQISKSSDFYFNLSSQAHHDHQSFHGALTSTPQKPIKQLTYTSYNYDENIFNLKNDLRIKKNLIKYFIANESSKTSSFQSSRIVQFNTDSKFFQEIVNPTNLSECSISKCHILIHESIDRIDKIRIVVEELFKYRSKNHRQLSFRENHSHIKEISLIDVNWNYIIYLIDHDLVNNVNKFFALIYQISGNSHSSVISKLKGILSNLNFIYDQITTLYECSDLTTKFLNDATIKRLRHKIEFQRLYSYIFDESEEKLFNHVKELNRLVYHNSFNFIDMDQVLAPGFISPE